MLHYGNEHRGLPGEPSYLSDAIHCLRTGRLVFVDGEIAPGQVTITGAEEESMTPTKKPIAKGCLAQHS